MRIGSNAQSNGTVTDRLRSWRWMCTPHAASLAHFFDQDDATRAHLGSMWTAPMHRHRSISRLSVNEVLGWARLNKARTLQLMVTSNNEPAILFYQRLGFTRTGRTEPYPNDPVLIEYEMSLPISLAMSSSTLHTVPLCDNSDKRPSRQCLIS